MEGAAGRRLYGELPYLEAGRESWSLCNSVSVQPWLRFWGIRSVDQKILEVESLRGQG